MRYTTLLHEATLNEGVHGVFYCAHKHCKWPFNEARNINTLLVISMKLKQSRAHALQKNCMCLTDDSMNVTSTS